MSSKPARSNKEQVASTFEPPRGNGEFAHKRLQAVRFLAEESLTRMEQILKQNPRLTSAEGAQSLEVDDNREYLDHKMRRIRENLQLLGQQMNLPADFPDARQILRLELLLFFVLVESCRPDRIVATGGELDQRLQTVLADCVENLIVDVINLRERLK